MRFPNIAWAVAKRRLPQYQLAACIGLSEAKLSRGLTGRIELEPGERAAIARVLGFAEAWLFREVEDAPETERLQLKTTRFEPQPCAAPLGTGRAAE
jgi:hypothetical protein